MRYRVHPALLANTRCIDGRLWRHDPLHNDPDLETNVGICPECEGDGCDAPPPYDEWITRLIAQQGDGQ